MRIDAIKRVLDALPEGSTVTLVRGHDPEFNLFELADAAPRVVEDRAYAPDMCISAQKRCDEEDTGGRL